MNKYLYNFEIKALFCFVELYINDVLVFCHYEENGSVWIDWPINQYILESGVQKFDLKILPYVSQTTLAQKTQVEVGVHAIDTLLDDRIEIAEKQEVNIVNKEYLPIYIHSGTFNARVKYKNTGWNNSVNLSEENENTLLSEILQWNSRLLKIYVESDLKEYNKVYRNREVEFACANYIDYVENTEDVFHSQFKYLISLPDDLYKLVFYAEGKLASVKLPYELPGFTYESTIKDENSMGISLILFFHRKKKGEPLEIIR